MKQMARDVTLVEEGFLNGCPCLLHDQDTKFCAGFDVDPPGCRRGASRAAGAKS
jgi:hypothetical protein